jgi:hypothetical protein
MLAQSGQAQQSTDYCIFKLSVALISALFADTVVAEHLRIALISFME